MKRMLILVLMITGVLAVYGQNQLDELGRKTGPWKVETPEGNTLYEATFYQGIPLGLMIRYYKSGKVRARMMFESEGDRMHAELYYESGKKAAEGLYVKKAKDSLWTYFSEFDGTVRITERYSDGKLDGISSRYYPNGTLSEEINWDKGSREGPWMQYFENGYPRLIGHYEENQLNGPYKVFFGDSTLMMSGIYRDDKSHGTWSYYDESGTLLYTLEYHLGLPVDQEKYHQLLQDTLLRTDTILEPEPVQFF